MVESGKSWATEGSSAMPMLHQMPMSGNCYKIRLAAHQLGLPLTLRDYPLHDGETRKPPFLAKNPNGRVPLLEFEDGRCLAESGAIHPGSDADELAAVLDPLIEQRARDILEAREEARIERRFRHA